MNIITGIYLIQNKINGKKYVGSSVNVNRRWIEHKSVLNRKHEHENIHLSRSWQKHGEENFIFTIIEECPVDKLMEREQYYIDTLKPEYNIAPKASSCLGVKHTEETKNKNRVAKLGGKLTQEHKDKIQKAMLGRVMSEEWKNKISKALTGKKHTDETKKKLSIINMGNTHAAGNKGKIISEETKLKMAKRMTGNTICKGRKLSEEHKKKIADGLRRYRESKLKELENG